MTTVPNWSRPRPPTCPQDHPEGSHAELTAAVDHDQRGRYISVWRCREHGTQYLSAPYQPGRSTAVFMGPNSDLHRPEFYGQCRRCGWFGMGTDDEDEAEADCLAHERAHVDYP